MRIVFGALLAAVLTIALAYSAAAAVACPSCYGFTSIGDNIFIDRTMPQVECK